MSTNFSVYSQPKFSAVDPAVPISDLDDFDYRGWENDRAKENRIVHEVMGRYNASYEESRYMRQFEWRRNWEFASGNQWIYWNEEIPDFCSLPIPEEMKYTENQFRGTMRQGLNMLVQGDPAFDALPRNSDWNSREAARLAKMYLFAKTREFNLGRLRVQNVQDAILFGFGIRKTYWQPAGGAVDVMYKPSLDEESMEPQPETQDEEAAEGEPPEPKYRLHKKTGEPLIDAMGYTGEMRQESTSPWMFFPQPGRDGPYLEKCDFALDAAFVSPAWAVRAHPDRHLKCEDIEQVSAMPYQLLQPGDINWTGLGSTQNRRPPQGSALMITYYQQAAPKRGHECGLEIRICGSRVLYVGKAQTCSEKAPYKAPLPFAMYAYEARRGTFYPRPPASDWVEPQMRINQILSDQYQLADLVTRPNLLTTRGDGTPDVISMGLQKWEIPQGWQDPRWLTAPSVPPQLFAMKADAEKALDRVAMLFGATRGERSSNDPSGYYLDVLREHDQIDLQSTVRDHARAEEQCGELVLILGKKYEPAEQMLQIVGNNGKPMLARFQKEKLRPEEVRVVVQATSIMPFLASSRRRAAIEIYEKGLLGPPGGIDKRILINLVKWMDNPGLFDMLDLVDPDINLCDRLHSMMIDEQAIPIPPGLQEEAQQAIQMAQAAANGQLPPPEDGSPPPDPRQLLEQAKQAVQANNQAQALIKNKRGFLVDSDWDPDTMLLAALERKKEDDYGDWPDRSKQVFEQYITILKQSQSAQQQQQQQAQMQAAEAQLALQAKYQGVEQDNQARGRAKTHVMTTIAQAMLQPDPKLAANHKLVESFWDHFSKWSLAEEPGGMSGKPGGRGAGALTE